MAAKKKAQLAEEPEYVVPEVEATPAEPAGPNDPRLCAAPGCDRPNVLHRLCDTHHAGTRADGGRG